MGCNVVVLSGSDRKKDEAFKLGAKEFVATKDAKELKVSSKINRLIVTTSVLPDWEQLMPILAPRATIIPLSIAGGNFSIPYSEEKPRYTQIEKLLLTRCH
jgi:D-arabinose 1-dehydrogenase-like Zn-dependent alcohol dehydrogenase